MHQSRIILFTLAQTLAFYLCGKFYFFLSLLFSHIWLFVIPWTAGWQTSLSFTISQSLHKLMSIELMMPYNHLILCWPLLLLPSVFPSIRVFSKEWALDIRWPNYWEFQLQHQSFQYIQIYIQDIQYNTELISFRIDWFDLLAVQSTFKSPSSYLLIYMSFFSSWKTLFLLISV